MKALCVIRVSTDRQEADAQREEVKAYANSMGYDELVYVEAIGASAIKLDAKYLKMAEDIKSTILADRDIKAVIVWELSRLGRNEVILMGFKEFFIKNKIQFICKTPTLKLLDDDGSVNTGVELAFSLFATMAKQEMQTKMARFNRTRKANSESGKFNGGWCVKYGYILDENKYLIPDPTTAPLIKEIYLMYNSGQYSYVQLSKELNERGLQFSVWSPEGYINTPFTYSNLKRILGDEAYKGDDKNRYYPSIVSEELWSAVEIRRKTNNLNCARSVSPALCARLIVCPSCGAKLHFQNNHYVCHRHSWLEEHKCDSSIALRASIVENLAIYYATLQEAQNVDDKSSIYEEIEVIKKKLSVLNNKIDAFNEKKSKIMDLYIDGFLDNDEKDKRLKALLNAHKEDIDKANGYKEQISILNEKLTQKKLPVDFITSQDIKEAHPSKKEEIYKLIHSNIKEILVERTQLGKLDKRNKLPNAIQLTFVIYGHKPVIVVFNPKKNVIYVKDRELLRELNLKP